MTSFPVLSLKLVLLKEILGLWQHIALKLDLWLLPSWWFLIFQRKRRSRVWWSPPISVLSLWVPAKLKKKNNNYAKKPIVIVCRDLFYFILFYSNSHLKIKLSFHILVFYNNCTKVNFDLVQFFCFFFSFLPTTVMDMCFHVYLNLTNIFQKAG